MGRGNAGGMHGKMLGDMVDALALPVASTPIVWQRGALGNLLNCARHRIAPTPINRLVHSAPLS